jgi:hypothetical protein
MKVKITGASNFVNRMFEACGNYQWAREFLQNSLEAGAKRVEFGIEWQAVEKHGIYRRTIIDNGAGMTPAELLEFFSTLGVGSKVIGGIHENFGVGAKIAALPWNPDGLVVISFKGGEASMIRIVSNPETNEYELVEFETPAGLTCVLDPTDRKIDWGDDVNWGAVAPDWAHEHGTVIVLMGGEGYADTVLGNAKSDETDIKGLSVYLNTRFWDLSSYQAVVTELRSEKKNSWPLAKDDRDDSRRPNNRQIMGALHYVKSIKSQNGRLGASDSLTLDEGRVIAEWYLWDGERPAVHSYAKKGGYVAVRYKGELFDLSSQKNIFRAFGVVESKVQSHLSIILEPQLYDPRKTPWGVHPDQSRNRLIFTGGGEKGVSLPLTEWGLEFSEAMPEAIREAIRKARGEAAGSLDDEEYRKRLQDRFGNRWTIKRQVAVGPKIADKPEGASATKSVDAADNITEPKPFRSKSKRRHEKTIQKVRFLASEGEGSETAMVETFVDVPKYRFASKEDFEHAWHLAAWNPNDPDGPSVVINQDAPVLLEAIKHHQEQYPDVYAEEISKTVMQVYGEIAVAKIAHSQKLSAQIPEQELDSDYRSEKALTVALMGLLGEEAVIAQRLGKFGRKKSAA